MALALQSHSYRLRIVHTALAWQSHGYRLRIVRTALARLSHSYRPDSPAQLLHGKAIASLIRLLDFVYAKTWQTLATVSPSVLLVRSTKIRLSLSHQLTRPYTTKLPTPTSTTTLQQCNIQSTYDSLLWTALALQKTSLWTTRCTG